MPVPARLQRWLPLIQKYAARHGVPADLLAAIVDFESGGDPNAGHKTSGATGLGQVMPREAGFPGRPTRQELLDPDTNLDWSARILADGYKRWKTPQQAAAAYLGALDRNGNVTNAADANGTTGHAYVQKIMGNLQSFGADVRGAAGQPLQQTPAGFDVRKFLDSLPPPGDPKWATLGTPSSVSSPSSPGGRMWPVAGVRPGSVTNPFGARQVHSAGSEGLSLPASNTGADLVARWDSPIVAEDDGRVVEVYQARRDSRSGGRDAKENFGYGGSVIVQYRDGSKARYSHMAAGSAAVAPGQTVRRGQLLGKAGDSGNATGVHVDYMYWDPRGNLADGTKQPGLTGGQVTVGAVGQPLAPGQEGQRGQAPAGAPTMSQQQVRQFLDTLPPPGQARPAGAQGAPGAQPAFDSRAFLDALPPPPGATAKAGATPPGMRDAAFVYGRDEPQPTPWDYQGTPGLRDAAFVHGRDEAPGVQLLSDTGATPQARQAMVMTEDQPTEDRTPPRPPQQPPALIPAPGQPSIFDRPPAGQAPAPQQNAPRFPWDPGFQNPIGRMPWDPAPGAPPPPPGGEPPKEPERDQTPNPEPVDRPQDPAGEQAAILAKYGEDDPNPPIEGEAANPRLQALRTQRTQRNLRLAQARKDLEAAQVMKATPDPYPQPATNAQQEAHNKWVTQQEGLDKEILRLTAAETQRRQELDQTDASVGTELKAIEAKTQNPPNQQVQEITYPDGRKVKIQWNPATKQWEELPGVPQGGMPDIRKVTAHPMGGYTALVDEQGNLVATMPQTLGPDDYEPKIVGSSTGPEMLVYNPGDKTVTKIKNPAYENRPLTQLQTSLTDRYIIRQDPTSGELKAEANPNYQGYGKENRVEGKGLAEGKITFIDPTTGELVTKDTLSPEERAGTQKGAEADITKAVAEAEKLRLEADIKKKEQAAWDEVQKAIDAGATPAEVRGLVEKAARSVDDYAKLRAAETAARTQTEAARHNLATEAEGMRTRRTAEAGEARQGAESYGRYGIASAPFQTALLGSLSQVADPRQVGAKMNIDQGVIDPVASVFDKRQGEYQQTQDRASDLYRQGQQPWTSPYKPAQQAGGTAQGGTQQGGTQQPAGGTQQGPTGTPPGPSGTTPVMRVPGQTYTGNPVSDPARQAVDLGGGKARTYYDDDTYEDWDIPQQGAQPEPQQEGPDPNNPNEGYGLGGGQQGGQAQGPEKRKRKPAEGKRAQWLGNGWVKTEYDDGAIEQWHVDDGPSWEGVGGGGAGYWGEDPPTMHTGWEKGTVGGGGSLWTLPPPPSMDAGYGAATALAQAHQNPPQPAEQPAGTAGGFAGPAPQFNTQGGGGAYGEYAPGGPQGQTGVGPAAAAGSGTFGTVAPSALTGQRMAPMWDSATPAPFATSGVGGPSGGAGQGTLYGAGAASTFSPVAPVGGGGPAPGQVLAPPRTTGSYYGGPGLPQAMSPLQRLLQQSGVIPLHAGRAAGSPGTV